MSRHFTGASGDYIDLGPGAAANIDGGPGTIMVLWRPTTVHEGWLLDAETGAGLHAFSINPYTDGAIWHTMVGFRSTMTYTAGDGWRLDLWTKPTGTVAVRGHTILLSGGGWTHTDYGSSADSTNVPTTHFRVGRHFTAGGALNGDIAAMAVIGADWSDVTIEGASLTTGIAQWLTAIGTDPAVVWAFNQPVVSDPVLDVTGGGGDQLAISGTSIGTDPPGFSYLVSTPTDCTITVGLPALDSAYAETSSATGAITAPLPVPDAHLLIGANVPPPLMAGTAVLRALAGTAVAT